MSQKRLSNLPARILQRRVPLFISASSTRSSGNVSCSLNCLSRYPDASVPAASKKHQTYDGDVCLYASLFCSLSHFPLPITLYALPQNSLQRVKKTEAASHKGSFFLLYALYSLVPDLSFVSVILRILTGSLSYCKLLLYPSESFVSPKMPFPTFLTPSCR